MTEYVISRGRCPTCNSPSPERHPAMQHEGEVETCVDDFHLQQTNMNDPRSIARVHEKRAMLAAGTYGPSASRLQIGGVAK